MKMKKRKNQDEEKKGKNINREERDKEMRDFFFFLKFINSILAYFKIITLYY